MTSVRLGPHVPIAAAAVQPAAPALTTFRQWYLVIALTLLYGVAAIDRSAIFLVVDPIKADLGLNDTQISLLAGASLSLFQLVISIPMGWMVDRYNRKFLLTIGAVLWACTTASCGLAQNFWQLFIGRVGVGFSEGGIGPASFSLIRDAMPPEKRGRAFGLYGAGGFVGGASALLVSGAIVMLATRYGPVHLPLVGELKTWQLVFVVIGLCSLPFAALLLPAVEPPRKAGALTTAGAATYRDAFAHIAAQRRLYLPLGLFTVFFWLMCAGYAAWGPAMAHRNYGTPLPEIGLILGLIVLVFPALGMFTVGSIVDWLAKRGRRNGAALVGLWMLCLTAIPEVATPLMPTANAYWVSYAILMFVSGGIIPITQVLLSRFTPSHLSGKVMALYSIIQVVFGTALGPLFIGLASDNLFEGPRSLAFAVSLNAALFVALVLLSAVALLRATRHMADE